MAAGDVVNLVAGEIPEDVHCRCEFCTRAIGTLRPPGGGFYSRLERNQYYDRVERGTKNADGTKNDDSHIAKTPLHVARWLVQTYSQPGGWVLDPTIGAGTTAVESLTQGRNAAGMEIQFAVALKANLERGLAIAKERGHDVAHRVRIGDARRIGSFLDELDVAFDLIVTNPPYSGDEHAGSGGVAKSEGKTWTITYKDNLPNLAFLKEGQEYFDTLTAIYTDCVRHLKPGGHIAFSVKDMCRNKKPFMLHSMLNGLLSDRVGLTHAGTAFIRHHPTTFFLNTYFKRYGVHPPYYQTISVFKKT